MASRVDPSGTRSRICGAGTHSAGVRRWTQMLDSPMTWKRGYSPGHGPARTRGIVDERPDPPCRRRARGAADDPVHRGGAGRVRRLQRRRSRASERDPSRRAGGKGRGPREGGAHPRRSGLRGEGRKRLLWARPGCDRRARTGVRRDHWSPDCDPAGRWSHHRHAHGRRRWRRGAVARARDRRRRGRSAPGSRRVGRWKRSGAFAPNWARSASGGGTWIVRCGRRTTSARWCRIRCRRL